MNLPGPEEVLAVFVLFCRIGAMLMLMPGTSSGRIPARVRLFVALALSLALAPLLVPQIVQQLVGITLWPLVALIGKELLTGGLIGLLARMFFLALQTLAAFAAFSVGFSGIPGQASEDGEPLPAFVTLITVTAAALLFYTDQHWDLIRGLVRSYDVLPPSAEVAPRFGLVELTDRASETFFLTLQIASPFLIYSVLVNLATGIANKLTPQIPVYFIALPFVLAGGLFILYYGADEMLRLFLLGFSTWLRGTL